LLTNDRFSVDHRITALENLQGILTPAEIFGRDVCKLRLPGSLLRSPRDISGAGEYQGVAESEVHRSMKAIVRSELEREDYAVVEEPLFPPREKVSWSSYRPDLLGYRSKGGTEEIVLVECETHPNMRRLGEKRHRTVWFQPYLFRRGSVRKILAVPQGKLGAVDMKIRNEWEVWVLGGSSPLERFPKFS
jgi:hypothetical protein